MMDPVSEKVKRWIDDGKDPRSAHWQGGLESILNVFLPYLEPGRLTPVLPLEPEDEPIFNEALEIVDLSPNLLAAFLPPAVAGKISPPESAPELQRIDTQKPSYKLLLARPGKELRIACVELSEHAEKTGIDIFQSGALLGTYDFEERKECLLNLNKLVRAHVWEKDKWSADDHKRYTINWFERVLYLQKGTVTVEKDRSFFHTPTLIKSNRIDAMFALIYDMFLRRADAPDDQFNQTLAMIRGITDDDLRSARLEELAEKTVIQFLTVIKELEIVDFDSFSENETRQFTRESARTVRKLYKQIT